MRKTNSTFEYAEERGHCLLTAFRRVMASSGALTQEEACRMAAESTAPRFWVSEERARRVIVKMLEGRDETGRMLPEKRRMYGELFMRCRRILASSPGADIDDVVFEAVNQPAPSHYMSVATARRIIMTHRVHMRAKGGGYEAV